MSTKKAKKFGDINIPAQSLHPPDQDGYLTKQGGSIRTWKRRYFILKDRTLYYYKTPKDQVITGRIDLEPGSLVKEEPGKKKANLFSVFTAKRIYYMFPDKPEEVKDWMNAISKSIERVKASGAATPLPANPALINQDHSHDRPQTAAELRAAGENIKPRKRLALAKGAVKFLADEDSKVLEFWQIWSESIPAREEVPPGMFMEFHVAVSADLQKLTWRTAGPQNVFIQRMVDFFWNVGAPESEIDRLNDVGALINPIKIGSWIDMSAKGGMDGGWFFPVEIALKLAIEAADPGESVKKLGDWAEANGVTQAIVVGRDMGAAPPRQTEIRVRLPGTPDEQVRHALDAWSAFGIPPMPDEAASILRASRPDGILLSVVTSSEGFVRVGIQAPKPSTDHVLRLCNVVRGNNEELAAFEGSLGAEGPSYVEYQHLVKGFGYSVYKEGFDIMFHYFVGQENSEDK